MAAPVLCPPALHVPVLLEPLLRAIAPVYGRWLDGTLGGGGYARALLRAGARQVIGMDRDPNALRLAQRWGAAWRGRLRLVQGAFSTLAEHGQNLDGVVLDLGVSSMQLDTAERGFSFQREGPLDMRMSGQGHSAADIVNTASETALADILFHYGQERASRRIARAIVRARAQGPIGSTRRMADIIASCLPRARAGQIHPATRSFQALRVAVNDEYGELYRGLAAAERALAPNGLLAVVSFHSIEDRMTKRFMQIRSAGAGGGNRHAPEPPSAVPTFELLLPKAVRADAQEVARNPRARSAKLRVARRTAAPAGERLAPHQLGMPQVEHRRDG